MSTREWSLRPGVLLAALVLAPAAAGQDAGGMFIHWSVDGQLGGVISHSMAGVSGAAAKYVRPGAPLHRAVTFGERSG